MVADFSALDAELDDLGAGKAVDAAALASSWVGAELHRLSEIDAALSALAADVRIEPAAAYAKPFNVAPPTPALPTPALPTPVPPSPQPEASAPARLDSDEIALPNAMRSVGNDESGELTLDGATPQSGSFALPYEGGLPSADAAFVDDLTFDADVEDLLEVAPAEAPPPRTNGNGGGNGLFELHDRETETDRAAEADFAALFPDPPLGPVVETSYDDTEIFDSSVLEFDTEKPKLAPIENAFTEELDSAEFEIVMDSTDESGTQATPSSTVPPHHPSTTPPEKRPSFLGRLFGRKED